MTKKPTSIAPQNLECYARALGNCSGDMSDEHYLSKAVLRFLKATSKGNPQVYAKNIAGLPPGVRRLREIGRMKARILCTTHNASLHLCDNEGLAICRATLSMYDADNSHDPATEVFKIDGDRLELWMLKVFFGGLYCGKVWSDLVSLRGQPPSIEGLEILYGLKQMLDQSGLYWLPTHFEGKSFQNRDEVEFLPWIRHDDGQLLGCAAGCSAFTSVCLRMKSLARCLFGAIAR